MGGFNVVAPNRFGLSPAPPWTLVRPDLPQLLVNIKGECVYASKGLARLLQCGLHELYGTGWRCRISPFAHRPFDAAKALAYCQSHTAMKLQVPDGSATIVTRIEAVTDPHDRFLVTGFYGRVQVIRVVRRKRIDAIPTNRHTA